MTEPAFTITGDLCVEVPTPVFAAPPEGAIVRLGFGHLVAFYTLAGVTLDESRGVWSARLEPKVEAEC